MSVSGEAEAMPAARQAEAMPVTGEGRWMPAWLALVRTYTRLWEQVEAQMRRDTGLTMARYDVLAHLDNSGGRLGLTDLASSILLSQSGLSKLLDRMEAAGLVRRDPDPRDGRAAFAAITPQGRSLVKKARRSHHEFLRQTFAEALDENDLIGLARIMDRIGGSIPARTGG
jgi:DNA-binding MarR family transcriptional regulator